MNKKIEKLRIVNKDEWAYFANAYLELSYIGFEKFKNDPGDDPIDKFIVVSSLFNLKHGIEIMLKTLSIKFLSKEYLNNSELNHDLDKILTQFKKDVTKKEIEEAAKEFVKKDPDAKLEDLNSESIFKELENLVLKYINLDFLRSKITPNDLVLEDLSNTALRYPSNDLNVHLHYSGIIERITHSEIVQMQLDCSIAKTLLWKLLVLNLSKKR